MRLHHFLLPSVSLVFAVAAPASADLRVLREWKASPVLLQHVEFSPDGLSVLTASGAGVAQLWSIDGSPGPELKGQRPPMFRAHFSTDGRQIITTGYDGTAWTWSRSGDTLRKFAFHRAATAEARFFPASPKASGGFVSSSDDGQVVFRDADGVPTWSSQFIGTARQLAIHPNLSLVVAGTDDGQLHLVSPSLDRRTAKVDTVRTPHGRINRISFSPDQTRVALAGIDGSVTLWDLNGRLQNSLKASASGWSRGVVYCLTQPASLLTIGDDGRVQQWSTTGRLQSSLQLTNTSNLTSVDCSADGRQAVVVSSTGDLWMLSVTGAQP